MSMQNLFVAKLPRNLGDNDLAVIFREHKPVSAKVMLDATTGKSKGFGFVLFNSEEEGQKAYDALNRKSTRSCGHNFTLVIYPSNHDGKAANETSNALYIRNIPMTISQECVEQFLRSFGKLTYCAMREDHYGSPVWVVYAEYNTVEEARAALIKLHGNHTYFHGSAPILAKFEDSEAAKRQRRQRREGAVSAESIENKFETNDTKISSTDNIVDKNNHGNNNNSNINEKTNIIFEKQSVCDKQTHRGNLSNHHWNSINRMVDSSKINKTYHFSNKNSRANTTAKESEIKYNRITTEVVAKPRSTEMSMPLQTTYTTTTTTTTNNNNNKVSNSMLTIDRLHDIELQRANSNKFFNSNHTSPLQTVSSTDSLFHSFPDHKTYIVYDNSYNIAMNNKNAVLDHAKHTQVSNAHFEKSSLVSNASVKTGFVPNSASLVTGLSSSMSCSSTRGNKMLEPSQSPPPYCCDPSKLTELEAGSNQNMSMLTKESTVKSEALSHSINQSSYNTLSQSYMIANAPTSNTTSTIPSNLLSLTHPSELLTIEHTVNSKVDETESDNGMVNYCYMLSENGEPILLGKTAPASPVIGIPQTVTTTESYSGVSNNVIPSNFTFSVNDNVSLAQHTSLPQSMTCFTPATVASSNNNHNYNNNNNVNSITTTNEMCTLRQQTQLYEPLNAEHPLKTLSLLMPEPQSTMVLIDGTQKFIVSNDAVNVPNISSSSITSSYIANTPMLYTPSSIPQVEEQHQRLEPQQEQKHQLTTQIFDLCYGNQTPSLPQVLTINSTVELLPQLVASLGVNPEVKEVSNNFVSENSTNTSIPEVLYLPPANAIYK